MCTYVYRCPERKEAALFHLLVKGIGSGVRRSSDPSPTITTAVTLSIFLNIVDSWFPHLKNEDNNDISWVVVSMNVNYLWGNTLHNSWSHSKSSQNISCFNYCSPTYWIGPHYSSPFKWTSMPTEVSRACITAAVGICRALTSEFCQATLHYTILSSHLALTRCLIGEETHSLPMPDSYTYLSAPR